MIHIVHKKDCCGCGACIQKCPKQCISISVDNEGFEYPEVDEKTCVDCGLCEQVCPILNRDDRRPPLGVYAAKNTQDEVRKISSSGGVFSVVAQQVLRERGVVFGACFDDSWQVVIDYIEKEQDLDLLRRSKYLQAKIGDSYQQTSVFLKQGRRVLYSGTPCQIQGLRHFLGKDYPNLLTIDLVCHGVPSPKVWELYLDYRKNEIKRKCESMGLTDTPSVVDVNFRDKLEGNHWEDFYLTLWFKVSEGKKTITYSSFFYDDLYFKLFLSDAILRPSCYKCPVREGRSGSDLTIADYWSINDALPEFNDRKGVNLLLVNSNKGIDILHVINNIELVSTPYEVATRRNGGFSLYTSVHPGRKFFFRNLEKIDFIELAQMTLKYKPSLLRRVLQSVISRVNGLFRKMCKVILCA